MADAAETATLAARLDVLERDVAATRKDISSVREEVSAGFAALRADRETDLRKALERTESRRPAWWQFVAAMASAAALLAACTTLIISMIDSRVVPVMSLVVSTRDENREQSTAIAAIRAELALTRQALGVMERGVADAAQFQRWYMFESRPLDRLTRIEGAVEELRRDVGRVEGGRSR